MSIALRVTEHAVPLRTPLVSGWGVLRSRTIFSVELEGPSGTVGRGEAAPLEPYDGVSDDACRRALATLVGELRRRDDDTPGHLLMAELQAPCDCAPALSAVDLALWDRAGRDAGLPVARLLERDARPDVAVHATIGGSSPEQAAEQAAAAVAAGFTAFKVKVGLRGPDGRPDLDGDLARLAAVRGAAGPGASLKLDANGGWSVEEAMPALAAACRAPLHVSIAEEPVSGGEAWTHLRAAVNAARLPVELSIDETADREPGALRRGADLVELKLARTGGIGPLLVQAAAVTLAGAKPSIASTFDGPLGIAAAVHVAAALGIERPLGLATLDALDLSGAPELAELAERLAPVAGRIAVPAGPGLL